MTHPPQSGAPVPGQQSYPGFPPPPYQGQDWQSAYPAPQPPGRGSRVLGVLGIALVVLVVVAAVGGTAYLQVGRKGATTPAYVVEQENWRRVADGLTRALAAGDEEGFVRPFAAGEVKERQRLVFRNLRKVPWETARWEVSNSPLNGRLRVDFVHQVKDVDNLPIAEEYGWQVLPVESGTEVITGVGAVRDHQGKSLDAGYYPAPWDVYDDLSVRVRDHLVAMADRGQEAELDRDVDVLARAAGDDLAAWQQYAPAPVGVRRGARGFFVVLEKNREVYNKLYQGDGKQDDSLEAGVNMPVVAAEGAARGTASGGTASSGTAGGGMTVGGMTVGGSRIVMDTTDSRFTGSRWQDGVTDIGRHEMAHAIVATLLSEWPSPTGKGQPHDWVAEGFAEFMALRGEDAAARDELVGDLREVRFDGGLPGEQGEFYADTAGARAANYALSGDAVRYLAATYGEARAFAFVAAHYARPSEYAQQLAEATGGSADAFRAAWAEHVRTTTATAAARRK
ncbi:hypothetical protein [Kitasatospora sp. SolWspMP-SS2h]|uniref:hypothetical protein n=1 Tax=Kitasatospora sp. SolWspMP-SS2h TaxID=1305729 RepID=UPI000DB9DD09|nr:hypothetical protein [Kitasatospora sp. SolWspMP-SS2h]